MTANISFNGTRSMNGSGFTVGDYRRLFEGMSNEDKVLTSHSPGDIRESSSTTVTVFMNENNNQSFPENAGNFYGEREVTR